MALLENSENKNVQTRITWVTAAPSDENSLFDTLLFKYIQVPLKIEVRKYVSILFLSIRYPTEQAKVDV